MAAKYTWFVTFMDGYVFEVGTARGPKHAARLAQSRTGRSDWQSVARSLANDHGPFVYNLWRRA